LNNDMLQAYVLLLFLVLLCQHAFSVEVVIIGSGISGLAAARAIMDESATAPCSTRFTVTVLESEPRTGGRTFTNKSTNGFSQGLLGGEVDFGASWMHGSNQNGHPITALSKRCGGRLLECNHRHVLSVSAKQVGS
jgi:monoamine oxidase